MTNATAARGARARAQEWAAMLEGAARGERADEVRSMLDACDCFGEDHFLWCERGRGCVWLDADGGADGRGHIEYTDDHGHGGPIGLSADARAWVESWFIRRAQCPHYLSLHPEEAKR